MWAQSPVLRTVLSSSWMKSVPQEDQGLRIQECTMTLAGGTGLGAFWVTQLYVQEQK